MTAPVHQHLVVHLVAADLSPLSVPLIETLVRESDAAHRAVILQLGSSRFASLRTLARRTVPSSVGGLRDRRSVRRAIGRLLDARSADSVIVHAWSPRAIKCGIELLGAGCDGMLAEVDEESEPKAIVPPHWWPADQGRAVYLARTRFVRQRLLRAGAAPARVELVPIRADRALLDTVDRSALRKRLACDVDSPILTLLPPVRRETGAFVATWAALLAAQVDRDLRLLIPDEGREVQRLIRLAHASRHSHIVRLTGTEYSPAELMSAADIVLHVPTRPISPVGLAWALVAGRQIVASRMAPIDELLRDRGARLVPPNDPKATAQALLAALDRVVGVAVPDPTREHGADNLAAWDELVTYYNDLYQRLHQRVAALC